MLDFGSFVFGVGAGAVIMEFISMALDRYLREPKAEGGNE